MEHETFPQGFLWGTATSAYQIEGSPLADGATPSIWHAYAHRRGRIRDGTSGDVTCDHYNRWREDVALMRELGLNAYRFSVAWSRVMPEARKVNQRGIDFYSRLVDALIESGIEPCLTLFHWDTPLWLERMGGFASRESVQHLADYGGALFRALGDRVKTWITINEPLAYAYLGYVAGNHAPGHTLDLRGACHASHHLLLAHARLRDLYHGSGGRGRIGIANHNMWITARRERDAEAAARMDSTINRFYWDPLFRGSYPEAALRWMHRFLPRGFERDLLEMRGNVDFMGVNYYSRRVYQRAALMPYTGAREWVDPGANRNEMWEVFPEGLYHTLLRLRDEYGSPSCLITENGYPLPDRPGADPLDDPDRIDYTRDHLLMLRKAMAEGVACGGYFHWTLTDNFEWDQGTRMRFGLVRTDFATGARTPKRSASWYREVARTNGRSL